MKKLLLLLLVIFQFETTFAQQIEKYILEEHQSTLLQNKIRSNPFTTNYDVKYYGCYWQVDPSINYIKGHITSYFKPLELLGSIYFNMDTILKADSVLYHGLSISFIQTQDSLINCTFPISLPANVIDSITIYYHGNPRPSGLGSFKQGLHNDVPVIWTLSEPFGADDWWPCKNDLSDKADSIDVFITCPNSLQAVSNGLLINTNIAATTSEFHWKHNYPIATYLICLAVTNYSVYNDVISLPSGNLNMLNYVYPENFDDAQIGTQELIKIVQFFDSLFIQYPFSNEKYGHAQYGSTGASGMEHQTMTFVTNFNINLLSHELAHQWFGDYITCGSWKDIWLNEGFATYCEGITHQRFESNEAWVAWKQPKLNSIVSETYGSIYVDDTTSVSRIFSGRLTYYKGAYFLNMLRFKLGDEIFFSSIRNYLNDPFLKYNFSRTNDLQHYLEMESGVDLDEFFNDWFYGEGYPSYQIYANQTGNKVVTKINQTQSIESANFFEMPIQVLFKGLTQDTLITFENTFDGQQFESSIPFQVFSGVFDPNIEMVSKNNFVAIQNDYDFNGNTQYGFQIFPNPANDLITLYFNFGKNTFTQIKIFNVSGRIVQQYNYTYNYTNILQLNIANLPKGIYMIELTDSNTTLTEKLVKAE